MEKEKYSAFVLTMGHLCVGINLRAVKFSYDNGGKTKE